MLAFSTSDRMGVLPSFVFVWPSNCGFWSFTEMMAVRPSRMSSPENGSSFSFRRPLSRAYLFTTLVRALRKPSSCIPPSVVPMLLAKLWSPSW